MGNERADQRDPKVSRRYRDLGSEEPPEAIDRAILAAASRGSKRRHRWYFGFAAAAVLVLTVAVALQMERRSDPESVASVSPREIPREESPTPPTPPASPARPPLAAPLPRAQQAPLDTARKREERAADAAVQAQSMARTPEHWLERIAQLRKEGRNEEADKELAEFRKRYPDYAIPDRK